MKSGSQWKRFTIFAITLVLVLVVVLEAGALYKMVSMVIRGESPRQMQASGSIDPIDLIDPKEPTETIDPIDLTGEWVQTNRAEEDRYQVIYITSQAVEVYWITESSGLCTLYWSGTYTPPAEAKEPYYWMSKSGSAEKEFTYFDGTLTYSAEEADGGSITIEAERGTWGYGTWISTGDTAGDMGTQGQRLLESGDIGPYHIEIGGIAAATDAQGNPAVIITYTWTNNSDATASAMVMLMERAYQGDTRLTSALLDSSASYDSESALESIAPGETKAVQRAFLLAGEEESITFEVSEFLSHTKDAVIKDFDIPS